MTPISSRRAARPRRARPVLLARPFALALALLALPPALVAQSPRRAVPDSGVVTTMQQVTPAGVQSVFDGRVTGVRFATPDELWVVVPGSAYHLAWAANRVLARGAFDGRSGVQGVTVDPVTRRALVGTVGALPEGTTSSRLPTGAPLVASDAVTRLGAWAADARGDTVPPVATSGVLGDYMAGAPAVAARAGGAGPRTAVLPLIANDALAVLDADADTLLRVVPLGVAPVAAVLAADGAVAWVTNLGGAQPDSGERTAPQCCDPRAEPVRVDGRGLAAPGTVTRVDVTAGRVTHAVTVGRHPTALAWDEPRARLYVADGNADTVSVVDTRANALAARTPTTPFRERKIGLAPTAFALAPDGRTLYVALGGANAVAVYDVSATDAGAARFLGLIPTGWYPSSLDVSPDGRHLAVGALLGVGSGQGETGGSPGKVGGYVHAVRGSVNVVAVPTPSELAAYTTAVAENDRLTLAGQAGGVAASLAPRAGVAAQPVPERPGEPSTIRHVVFIVRENRTYDQILGDLPRGDGDSSLVIYGRDVTPNAHALAERFVTLDRFFASGGNSADGHQWLTQANETEYPMWPLYYGRSYPSEGEDPLAYSSGGFLWESAAAAGRRVAVFGEYAPSPRQSRSEVRARLMAQYLAARDGQPTDFRAVLRGLYDTRSAIPSLDRVLVREYPGWSMESPDVVKAADVLAHLADWTAADSMPDLVLMILPSDHTSGTSAGWCTPRACVADNDLALGQIVEGLTHSPFWRDMAILVVEDDAQNGVDHVDGHRTVALVASPYARRGVVDSTFYIQPSMVKTVELMLGLPALSLYDLVATDMRASFLGPGEAPDTTPYTALLPAVPLDEVNAPAGRLRGADAAPRRAAARASARMVFDRPDAAPSEALNRILWHDARGWGAPYPMVRRSLFFPLSHDVADDEREEREERAKPGAPPDDDERPRPGVRRKPDGGG